MKKVLFFINTLCAGGAEKALVELVNHMDAEKYQITVMTLWGGGIYESALKDHIQYRSIIKTQNPMLRRLVSKYYMQVLSAEAFYEKYIKADYDYEIAFLEGFPTKIISASTNSNSRKIAWLHTDLLQYPDSQNAYSKCYTERQAYEKVDSVFCVSQSVRESLQKKYDIPANKTMVLYNIVDDVAVRKKAAVTCPEKVSHPLLISVGRLTEQKGYDSLLRIHKRLLEEGVRHTLWIVGEGEKRQELEKYIHKHQLQHVKLLGFQENPYVFMAQADLFVSSSVAEGFSTVITESVILGVPVISTATAGAYEPPEAPRCSIVAKTEDELTEAIKCVLSDPSEQQKLKADVESKQHYFQKESFVKRVEESLLQA